MQPLRGHYRKQLRESADLQLTISFFLTALMLLRFTSQLHLSGRMLAERCSSQKTMTDAARQILSSKFKRILEMVSAALLVQYDRQRTRNPAISRADVARFMQGLKVREDRPQRGYNSYVPVEPMHQVDLADMSVFSTSPILQVVRPKRSESSSKRT